MRAVGAPRSRLWPDSGLDRVDAELATVDECDHVVRNVDIDEAAAELGALIEESRPGFTAPRPLHLGHRAPVRP